MNNQAIPLADRFMQRILYKERFFQVETDIGTEWVHQSDIGKTMQPNNRHLLDFCEGSEVYSVDVIDGWAAYLSAPGYMDRTQLAVFPRKNDAIRYLREIDE
jgi:hypothetical protein